MTYTLSADPHYVIRDEDGAFIPFDPDNIDYQTYLAWLDEGNEPTQYTPIEPEGDDNGDTPEPAPQVTIIKTGSGKLKT